MLKLSTTEKHMAEQHSIARHNAEENKNEKMSQGWAGDTGKCHFLPDLGTILKYFYKNTGEEGSKKKKKSDRRKKEKKCYG